ncbi:MAG: ATP-binding protein, partial [Bacteroidetes bacterium]|nr:ATP-binding protein [Bacteroidota bacterium]
MSIILQLFLRYYDVKQRTVLLDAQKTGFESIITNVLNLKKEKYASATEDYSGWDEMVGFTKNRSKEFAEANLNTVIGTYKVDYVWVYDENENIIHYTKNNSAKDIPSIGAYINVKSIFKNQPVVNFFTVVDSAVIQVFGGTIVPTSDFKTHYSKPAGYYLIAKIWDSAYIKEFERATASKIKIYGNNEIIEVENPDIETSVTRTFQDYTGNDFLKINFRKSNEYLVQFDRISIYSLFISAVVWLTVLLIFFAFSRNWITSPLNSIEKALITNDGKHLSGIGKRKNEFGDIAELMKNYFRVNKNLTEEVEHRKLTEIRLKENEQNLATVLNATNDAIVMIDRDKKIISANEAFLRRTGLAENELSGKMLIDKISDDNKNIFNQKIDEAESSGIPVFFENSISGKYFRNAVYPIADESGNINRFVIFSFDISEFKRNEQVLREAEERAMEMSRMKSSFLGNMSHELRTPMVGILGFAEIIRDKVDDEELKQMAEMINISGKRLMKTLNLILDLTRIEAGKLVVNFTSVDIAAVTYEVYRNFEIQAENKNLKFLFESELEKILVKTDGNLYWQIMNNLISNAVKYTEKGEVKVVLTTEKKAGNYNAVIKVSDTGIGIPEESLMIIFEEFRQVSEGYARKFEGTGLGLTITKRFIEILGGTISVSSILGQGTAFTVRFPAIDPDDIKNDEIKYDKRSEDVETGTKAENILCVDDDSITKDFLDVIFSKTHNIDFADNGPDAVEMAEKKKYSLILMDINLGKGMNGMEATREIRKIKGYGNVPVVAMTAYAMSGDDKEFFDAGLDAYISKPFDIRNIKKLVSDL